MNQPSEILDRTPPHSLDAEKGVIGSMILDPRVIDQVATIVQADHFYADANQRLFRHLVSMYQARRPIDIELLRNALRAAGEYDAIGGAAYITEASQSVPYAHNAPYYAAIVAEQAKRRAVINAATEALRDAWNPTCTINDTLDALESALAKIRTGEISEALIDAPTAGQAVLDHADEIAERKNKGGGIFTGLDKFDIDVGGFFPGEYVIVAAQSGAGKTALAGQIADHNASRGRLVYYASLEMDARELAQREVCGLANVNSRSIRTASLSADDRSRLIDGANQFSQRALRIDDRPYLKVADIRRAARRLVKEKLALVIVDYLGLIEPDDPKVIREQQVARISRALKNLAKELDVPVITLCQLNRENMPDERPALRHLRESGAIGQDADKVMFIHRPDQGIVDRDEQNPKSKVKRPWPAELILAKDRTGQTGAYRLEWNPAKTQFACWDCAENMPNYEPAFEQEQF